MSQQQKFHTDDVNQGLHNQSGSHGAPNAYLFVFTFLDLLEFGKVLCSSANELQQNQNAFLFHSMENSCFVIDLSHLIYLTFVAFCLSLVKQ